jgi:hypothetical protein
VRIIQLNGSGWQLPLDFLEALRFAIGGPEWHGMSPAAFVDSMIWHDFNSVRPPYVVHVIGLKRSPQDVVEYVQLIGRLLEKSEDDHSDGVAPVLVSA